MRKIHGMQGSKKIAELWKALTPLEKKPYILQARADKARYDRELALYLEQRKKERATLPSSMNILPKSNFSTNPPYSNNDIIPHSHSNSVHSNASSNNSQTSNDGVVKKRSRRNSKTKRGSFRKADIVSDVSTSPPAITTTFSQTGDFGPDSPIFPMQRHMSTRSIGKSPLSQTVPNLTLTDPNIHRFSDSPGWTESSVWTGMSPGQHYASIFDSIIPPLVHDSSSIYPNDQYNINLGQPTSVFNTHSETSNSLSAATNQLLDSIEQSFDSFSSIDNSVNTTFEGMSIHNGSSPKLQKPDKGKRPNSLFKLLTTKTPKSPTGSPESVRVSPRSPQVHREIDSSSDVTSSRLSSKLRKPSSESMTRSPISRSVSSLSSPHRFPFDINRLAADFPEKIPKTPTDEKFDFPTEIVTFRRKSSRLSRTFERAGNERKDSVGGNSSVSTSTRTLNESRSSVHSGSTHTAINSLEVLPEYSTQETYVRKGSLPLKPTLQPFIPNIGDFLDDTTPVYDKISPENNEVADRIEKLNIIEHNE
ncbi:hypothetical protein HDV04_002021 [Boothiomyces sp. JEL0838]|nr:hypothetical protein HDV04_002021 [Boothiomyces sp. JEL0838]